jgi:dipeptidyl aminopeptidase/acylaminoacyl peptidase
MSLRCFLQSLFVLSFVLPVWCAKKPIVETDLLKVQRVTEVKVAPDGSLAVYGVQSIHTEPPATPGGDPVSSYRVNLWMIDLRDGGSKPVRITSGDRNDSALTISPDGSQLAFVRADSKKHPQVWVMPLRMPGEPRMVTNLEHGAGSPHWRGDGKALLVSSAVPISKVSGKPDFDLERPGRIGGILTVRLLRRRARRREVLMGICDPFGTGWSIIPSAMTRAI